MSAIEYGSNFTAPATKGGQTFDGKGCGMWQHTITLTGTGAISATVVVESSDDGEVGWQVVCTLDVSGTDSVTDGLTGQNVPGFLRHRCTAISGTNAKARTVSRGTMQ